jgi:nitroimidazol reductase NimA-like FMN-containing flavoprotein (pyridoxamine 5'-phosphate oxidase superfamily)
MDTEPVTALDDDNSWNLISAVHLGRLVTVVDGRPEIFPVNFVVQRRSVLFRTAEGTKLFGAVMNDQVLFEADDHNVAEGWSVIVRGTAKVLFGADEIQDAEQAGLYPWIATQKLRYVRVMPQEVTGRKFVFGPEPKSDAVAG